MTMMEDGTERVGIAASSAQSLRNEITGRLGFFPVVYEGLFGAPQALEVVWRRALGATLESPLPVGFRVRVLAELVRRGAFAHRVLRHVVRIQPMPAASLGPVELLDEARRDELLAGAPDGLDPLAEHPAALEAALVDAACRLVMGAERPGEEELCRILGAASFEALSDLIAYAELIARVEREGADAVDAADDRGGPVAGAPSLPRDAPTVGPGSIEALAGVAGSDLFREIVSQSREAIAIVDTDGIYRYQNETHHELIGYSDEELRGKTPSVHLGDEAFGRIVAELTTSGRYRGEETSWTKGGRRLTVDLSAFAIRHAETGEPVCFVGIKRDVTERRRVEEATRESEERYRRLFENEIDAVLLFDVETLLFEDANQAALDLFGWDREGILTLTILDISAESEKTATGMAALQGGTIQSIRVPRRVLLRRDGTTFTAEIGAGTFVSRGRLKMIATIRDITERLRHEELVLEISGREQRRIGQDLHDGLGQDLTGIAFLAKSLERNLAARELVEETQAAELGRLLNQTISRTRDIASGLFPVELQSGGLGSALAELASNIGRIYDDVSVTCDIEGAETVPAGETRLQLFRIAQEAVTNALRHGQARSIRLVLRAGENEIVLEVQDDGHGLPAGASMGEGLGLQIMRYRAGRVGGALTLEAGPDGRGVCVRVVAPRWEVPG